MNFISDEYHISSEYIIVCGDRPTEKSGINENAVHGYASAQQC